MKRISLAVWHEKYKRWQVNVQKNGNRKSFYSSKRGRKGMQECHEKADLWIEKTDLYQISAEKFYSEWIEELKLTTSKAHWQKYVSFWDNWIHRVFSALAVGELTEQHLQEVLLIAYREKNLSKKSLTNIRGCMISFLKFCRKQKLTDLLIENEYIPRNATTKTKTILQPDDLLKLFSIDQSTHYSQIIEEPLVYAFRLEVVTGARPGEILGLHQSHINFTENTVSICQSFNTLGELTTGKNDNARRTFGLSDLARSILTTYLEKYQRHTDLLFPNPQGFYLSQNSYRKRWKRYLEFTGISYCTLYELRHTFISIIKQLPDGIVKSLVGHSVNMNTYKTYGHLLDGELCETAQKVNDLFKKILIG